MQMIHDEMNPGPELMYARSMINAFDPTLEGVRIPSLSPDQTVSFKEYQSIS